MYSFLLILSLSSIYITFEAYPNMKMSLCGIISMIMILLALSKNNYFYTNFSYINKVIDLIVSRSYSLYCCL